jgi:glutamate racemase
VLIQPCPGLAEQVEKGDLDGRETRLLVAQYVAPLLRKGVDSIVLGCTHYPFLAPVIRAVAGPEVAIIDPAEAVARELRRRLQGMNLLQETGSGGTERFYTSGAPETVKAVIAQLWSASVSVAGCPLARDDGLQEGGRKRK